MKALSSILILFFLSSQVFAQYPTFKSLEEVEGKENEVFKLSLQGKELTEIPPKVFELKNLKLLSLKDNAITEIPAGITSLKELVYLDIRNNNLTSIPAEIGALTKLQALKIGNGEREVKQYRVANKMEQLPDEIYTLVELKELDLSQLGLTSIQEDIGKLVNLEELFLSSNKLKKLPRGIGQLTKLTNLGCSSNDLSSIPDEIGELANLQYLWLGYNRLFKLPVTAKRLTKLESIYLKGNKFTTFPSALLELPLVNINLGRNKLKNVPDLNEMTTLKILSFSTNELTTIIDQIASLKELKSLNILNNKVSYEEFKRLQTALPSTKINYNTVKK